ncbi:phosphate ABC transporter ATP-binding protein [Campylobacter sp. Cr9]|uniref:phosphate ABC transporter ATP-binding protein PstB n=1 Tax=Campylobacter sp. Cr9 TaxID=2735728 RepID=UPI003014AA32|nr:phosphate ABC transporter ATP-binding protein [Campylobacter sp. Cr9]
MNCFEISNMNLYYKDFLALKDINLSFAKNKVHALIGPSGCGKSSFLSTLNKMVDLIEYAKITGEIRYEDKDIYKDYDTNSLRKEVGLIFQKPNPFLMSIYENITFAPKSYGIKNKNDLDEIVENSLKKAALFDELKDRLKQNASSLSGGQQQRLCIARALAISPKVLLMDEPTSALDPIGVAKIEELIQELKQNHTIIIVTHNMQQAARISDTTSFFLNKEVVESDNTYNIFNNAKDTRTKDYINGKFG